jgi:GSH-dependent disulfide-bond oxidoreductase
MADSEAAANNQPVGYVPPKVWTWDSENGGQFANINRPTSGATHDKALPVGKHPFQLYSMGTPNGVKVTIMFEELLAAGHAGAEYDAWMISIGAGDQFSSGFVAANPNSKIPALMDHSANPPTRVFESGSILFYLAEKFGAFFPTDHAKRTETMNWLMWQMASAPYVGGGLGHFYAYAPFKMEYPINRFAMETKRQLHVLDTHLAANEYMAGGDYTIADIAIWPWYGSIMREAYSAQEFLSVHEYKNLERWVSLIAGRPAVQRGRMVNRTFGGPESQLRERHAASDFDNNREDMVLARGGERV